MEAIETKHYLFVNKNQYFQFVHAKYSVAQECVRNIMDGEAEHKSDNSKESQVNQSLINTSHYIQYPLGKV